MTKSRKMLDGDKDRVILPFSMKMTSQELSQEPLALNLLQGSKGLKSRESRQLFRVAPFPLAAIAAPFALFFLTGMMCVSKPNPFINKCGNTVTEIENNEECDDGDGHNSDAHKCTESCQIAVCGDGLVLEGVEICDNGDANSEEGPCSLDCEPVIEGCGDGIVQADEECDDGSENQVQGESYGKFCAYNCTLQAHCGDGIAQAPWEQCDDANSDPEDACSNECAVTSCGDGIVQLTQGEECDDGNHDSTDSCLDDCTAAACGDGFVWKGIEQCDDANFVNTDLCLDTCIWSHCGDGYLYDGPGEWCDDGNTIDDDGCTNSCDIDRLIFVTEDWWGGAELGGIGTAGTRCWARADAAGHPRPMAFQAWLSDGEKSPLDYHHGDGRYVLSTGQVVAENWEDLVDGELAHAIDRSAKGLLVEGLVWTATAPDGSSYPDGNCGGWKDAEDELGLHGWSDLTDGGWTRYLEGVPCDSAGHLYCIEAF